MDIRIYDLRIADCRFELLLLLFLLLHHVFVVEDC